MSALKSSDFPSSSGRLNAKGAAKRLSKADIIDEVGRMKFGVHPFSPAAKWYMENRRFGLVGDNTYREEERKYRYLGEVFEFLKDEGKVSTTNPLHMGRKEVQALMWWMRTPEAIQRFKDLKDRKKKTLPGKKRRPKAIAPSAQEKYLQLVNNLLRAFKNHTIEEMREDGVRFPRAGEKAVDALSEAELEKILATINTMEGWRGSLARGMIPLYFGTGVRPSELRLTYADDLDMGEGKILIRHPKGEGAWAEPEEVYIVRDDMLPFIRRYLDERQAYLKTNGREDAEALFPSLDARNSTGFYSPQGFIEIKAKIERLSGVKFKLKDFRPTLTSLTVNGDIKLLPVMTAQLRHKNPRTTQRSYWLTQRGAAGKQLRAEWRSRGVNLQKGPISGDNQITG